MKKGFNSIIKFYSTALLALILLLAVSCKESSEESKSGTTELQSTEITKQTEQPRKESTETKQQSKEQENADKSKDIAEQASTAKTTLVALDIKLPKPMFVGTPQNIRVPNLEKPLGKPRPPFLAPAGTKNVALGKTVASTDEEPIIGEIEMITDGGKEGTDGSYVELGPFLQYVTIDLGAKHDIYAILLWHFHKQARVYFDAVVQVADDSDFITNVTTLFNNDHDNSVGLGVGSDMHYVETSEGRLIDAKGTRARYVRLYSNGNSSNELNHYIEVEVFGKPAI
ncbi:MAG: hypothetical protein ACYSU6_05275 [Planctomycetota bacterium]|jgi:hypothetical protein